MEDFPTELGEGPAEGLLNAFAVLWHPRLLAETGQLPGWRRADEWVDAKPGQLIIVPQASKDWMNCGWVEQARLQQVTIVESVDDRAALLKACLASIPDVVVDGKVPRDESLAADFMALGVCRLQSELLTRAMRRFPKWDEQQFAQEAVTGAKFWLSGESDTARQHVRRCFEMLCENREQFYPVDCFLFDVCLLSPKTAGPPFLERLSEETPLGVIVSATDLDEIARENPDVIAALKSAVASGRVEILGGEEADSPTALLPLDVAYANFQRGFATIERILGCKPTTWVRRRFGLTAQLPQLLKKFEYQGALHLLLDDGVYPDDEKSRFLWAGSDGSTIDAFSRIPLAGDSSSAFLRLPARMGESMDHDATAAVAFVRWPETKMPWLADLRRSSHYFPVLGRFSTFREFFARPQMIPPEVRPHAPDGYRSPFFLQAAAMQTVDPVSRWTADWKARRRSESSHWAAGMNQLLSGRVAEPGASPPGLNQAIDRITPESSAEERAAVTAEIQTQRTQFAGSLGRLLIPAGKTAGCLIINTLSTARSVAVDWPHELWPAPEAGNGTVLARQADASRRMVVVQLPPCGFVWLPGDSAPPPSDPRQKVLTAEGFTVRNENFEVRLSETSGGIAEIRNFRRSPNRLSQQLTFRFPRERTWTANETTEDGAVVPGRTIRTEYAEMRLTKRPVIHSGTAEGVIETSGEIIDQQTNRPLANFRQVVRVTRGLPNVDLEIELTNVKSPDLDCWSSYYGIRFAWRNEGIVLSRSVQQGAYATVAERLDAPDFLELTDDEDRTTILPLGLPFHRKAGPRMLDTILFTAEETARNFHLQIAVDAPNPQAAALAAGTPPIVITDLTGPPNFSNSWLFHLDAPNVILTRVVPVTDATSRVIGCQLRLLETEGHARTCTVRCFRPLQSARALNTPFARPFAVVDGNARVDLSAHEFCDIECVFA